MPTFVFPSGSTGFDSGWSGAMACKVCSVPSKTVQSHTASTTTPWPPNRRLAPPLSFQIACPGSGFWASSQGRFPAHSG